MSTLRPTLDPIPAPTPHPANTEWVSHRLDAVISLYQPTALGRELLHSLDVRQMQGEPGYFGSYGYYSWAGVGEAKPIPTMHELGHSYWGAFPVIAHPELEWRTRDGDSAAPALSAYHEDILTFMRQPPDDYEILRERLRNLPGLSGDNTDPLFHSLEADMPYTTGGDLLLIPPILRKYWGYFLDEGPFWSWENAIGWYQALSSGERATADKFLGFTHLNLDQYRALPHFHLDEVFLSKAEATLNVEERQRLTDLVEQFDLLIGDSQLEANFRFWRGYLRDKVALHRSHPEYLESLSLPMALQLSEALSFLASLNGDPESQVVELARQIDVQPFLVNFLPAVDDRALVKLIAANPVLPDGRTLQATASFVQRLQRFGGLVEKVLAAGGKSPAQGAAELQILLDETGFESEQDLKLYFDLLIGNDRELTRMILLEMNRESVRELMSPVPTQLRAVLEPDELLEKLSISNAEPEADLQLGITLLLEETSGNYRIEAPFLEQLFQIMAQRAKSDPGAVAGIVAATPFPLEHFILQQPAAATAVLSHDIDVSIRMVLDSDPVLAPPVRIIYRLIQTDPALAAILLISLDGPGVREIVTESLAYLAYDKARSEKFPALPISLHKDGALLNHLLERSGPDWLEAHLAISVRLYRERIKTEEVDPGFLDQYRATLEAAAALAPRRDRTLISIVSRAFE